MGESFKGGNPMSGIRVKNIYYMLAYAFNLLKEKEICSLTIKEFENADDLFAAVLILGISSQFKRGLFRNYHEKNEALPLLRGKVDLTESLKTASFVRRRWVCRYDEFSENNMMNRILKTTLLFLMKSTGVETGNRRKLRTLISYFANVEPLSRFRIAWNTTPFSSK